MNTIRYYIGLNDKDTKKQKIATFKANDIVRNIMGDCTIQYAYGCYTRNDGTVVLENTLVVTTLVNDIPDNPAEIIEALKKAFNQEAIAVEVIRNNALII